MNPLISVIKKVLGKVEVFHDSYTKMHEENTGRLMGFLAQQMGFDEQFCENLKLAGSLHDVGKIAIPATILEKPTSLNAYERSVIELHPQMGYDLLKDIEHPLAKIAAKINLSHHESYDGNGYPHRLKGKEIPIEARICTVCDVYDAIRIRRPYRDTINTHKSIVTKFLSKKSSGLYYHFDPEILDVFSAVEDKFHQIWLSK